MSSKQPPIGAELARAWTGASVVVYLINTWPDEENKFCCAVIVKDSDGTTNASKFLHSHLDMDEILEVLEQPGNMGIS